MLLWERAVLLTSSERELHSARIAASTHPDAMKIMQHVTKIINKRYVYFCRKARLFTSSIDALLFISLSSFPQFFWHVRADCIFYRRTWPRWSNCDDPDLVRLIGSNDKCPRSANFLIIIHLWCEIWRSRFKKLSICLWLFRYFALIYFGFV